jgi:triacylglycerol lipase
MTTALIPRLRTPIVLVHGLFGFSRVQVAGCTVLDYFPGIVQALEAAGNRVLVPALLPTAGCAARAQQLKDFLLKHTPQEPVHLLAHSMGGLDARYMIARLGMDRHVLSLTTLGTPHRGSAFADWGTQRLARFVQPVFNFFGLPCQAFYDLTRQHCKAFNEQVRDAASVRYFSVAGRHDGNFYSPEWLLPYHVVLSLEGPNDGVVSVESARYGEDLDIWDGDHLSLVNWLHPIAPIPGRGYNRDPVPRYGKILRRLADLGF